MNSGLSEAVLDEGRPRSHVADDGVFQVLKPNRSASCHVIKGHVNIGDVDDVIHCWRHEHELRLVHPST